MQDSHTVDSHESNCVQDQRISSEHGEYPEGGAQAWSVVLGAWCAMVPSMGPLNSLGTLQAWTSTHQLKAYPESSIGWIFGTYTFFLFVGGAQFGKKRLCS